jgi:hypothetical protein
MINADVDGSGVLVLIDEGVGEAFVRGGGMGEVMPLPLVLAATSICWLFFFLAIAKEFEKRPKKTIGVRWWLHFASINFDKKVEGRQANLGTEYVPQFPLFLLDRSHST